MTVPEITDKSLLVCTVKKSWHTVTKILSYVPRAILYASYVIVAITAIVIIGYGAINIIPVTPIISAIIAAVLGIPWWVYAIVAVPVGIFGHSLVWCIARELTEEDWKSNSANNFAAIVAALTALAALAAIALALALAALALAALALAAIALALALALAALAADPADKITVWYYIFRFPGAWWHHRKAAKKGADNK